MFYICNPLEKGIERSKIYWRKKRQKNVEKVLLGIKKVLHLQSFRKRDRDYEK